MSNTLWHVIYEDGDQEDPTTSELQSCLVPGDHGDEVRTGRMAEQSLGAAEGYETLYETTHSTSAAKKAVRASQARGDGLSS